MQDKDLVEEKKNIFNSLINDINDSNYPEIEKLHKIQILIEALDREIEEEKDQEIIFRKLKQRHEISKNQTKRLLNYITEQSQRYVEVMDEVSQVLNATQQLNMKLKEALETEISENEEFFDKFYNNLLYCMMTNPKETFEMILDQMAFKIISG